MAQSFKWWVLFWFSTIYRNYISLSGFFSIVWKFIQLIPYFFMLWNKFFTITKCCCSNRVVLSFPIHFWHLYSIHINLSNQHFSIDYGILKPLVPCFYHCSSVDRTLFFLMSIFLPSLCRSLILMPQLFQVQGYPFSYFSRQIELLLNLFLQAIPL